jgi:hypothetical protein
MKGRNFFIVCVLLFVAFSAGIYVGSVIEHSAAQQLAAVDHAKMKVMEREIREMREDYLAVLNELPRSSKQPRRFQ